MTTRLATIDDLSDAKSGGTGFTNSLIIGHHTTGALNSANPAEQNTGVGFGSMDALTQGDNNSCLGYNSGTVITTGSDNTCIGRFGGDTITTGSNNTCIGSGTDTSAADSSNQTSIGYNAACSADNQVSLGNSSVTTLRCGATTIASISDRRDKTNIKDSNFGLEFLETIRPVEFEWNVRELSASDKNCSKNGKKRLGFIAQELDEAVKPEDKEKLDLVYSANPERLEAKQGNLLPIMVKAIQDLSAQVKILQQELQELKEFKENN